MFVSLVVILSSGSNVSLVSNLSSVSNVKIYIVSVGISCNMCVL